MLHRTNRNTTKLSISVLSVHNELYPLAVTQTYHRTQDVIIIIDTETLEKNTEQSTRTLHTLRFHVRGPFEKFVDWRQYATVMLREAVNVMPSCSDGGNVVVA
jgi:hypothetical protein